MIIMNYYAFIWINRNQKDKISKKLDIPEIKIEKILEKEKNENVKNDLDISFSNREMKCFSCK